MPQLNNDDRCAVDLLLDRDVATSNGLNSCFSMEASSNLRERISRVETLLTALGAHRADEPAGDLVARTLDRCDRAAEARATHSHAPHAGIAARPVA